VLVCISLCHPLQVAGHRTLRDGIIALLCQRGGAGPELEAFATSQLRCREPPAGQVLGRWVAFA
jgi:hypothetical protein